MGNTSMPRWNLHPGLWPACYTTQRTRACSNRPGSPVFHTAIRNTAISLHNPRLRGVNRAAVRRQAACTGHKGTDGRSVQNMRTASDRTCAESGMGTIGSCAPDAPRRMRAVFLFHDAVQLTDDRRGGGFRRYQEAEHHNCRRSRRSCHFLYSGLGRHPAG